MKKIIIILILLFIFSSSVSAMSLDEIKGELEKTSTYQMYENMGITSISTTKDTLIIKYPSLNPDTKQVKSVKYVLKDNMLITNFTGDITNRFDVLDNSDLWTFELIDIIALNNGNSSDEIKSITDSYLKNTTLENDMIEVSYEDYDVVNLNGEEEQSNLIKSFQIRLDYRIKEDKIDHENSSIKLIKQTKKKMTLKLTSTLDNATCTLYYKDNQDDILYTKVSQVNCGKKDKDTKITIDIKDNTKTYYFISYLDNHPLESNVLEVTPVTKDYNYFIPLLSILILLSIAIIKGKEKSSYR